MLLCWNQFVIVNAFAMKIKFVQFNFFVSFVCSHRSSNVVRKKQVYADNLMYKSILLSKLISHLCVQNEIINGKCEHFDGMRPFYCRREAFNLFFRSVFCPMFVMSVKKWFPDCKRIEIVFLRFAFLDNGLLSFTIWVNALCLPGRKQSKQ